MVHSRGCVRLNRRASSSTHYAGSGSVSPGNRPENQEARPRVVLHQNSVRADDNEQQFEARPAEKSGDSCWESVAKRYRGPTLPFQERLFSAPLPPQNF